MLPESSFLCLVDEHGRLSARNQQGKPQGFDCRRTCLGDGKAGQLHQLINGEGSDAHKVFIQRSSIFSIDSLALFISSSLRSRKEALYTLSAMTDQFCCYLL